MDFLMKGPFEIMAADYANVKLNLYSHVVNIVAKIGISLTVWLSIYYFSVLVIFFCHSHIFSSKLSKQLTLCLVLVS